MKFQLKTDRSTRNFVAITLGIYLLCISAVLIFDRENYLLLIWITLFSTLFHYLVYKTSKIEINEDMLLGSVMGFKKRIKISDIRYIEYNHSWSYAGSNMKIAISKHNLIVHFGKFDEILLGPADEETFIKELQKINPEIYTKGEPR
ncbi:MAG: PH domain-containing protein [Crocinitomicaceae bacterium]|jgi:hypothetical protein|nr:PH domain-containing protein [Crocinitomicaceae bacterium]